MEERTCYTCANWAEIEIDKWGWHRCECSVYPESKVLPYRDEYERIVTLPGFGCNKWEPKIG